MRRVIHQRFRRQEISPGDLVRVPSVEQPMPEALIQVIDYPEKKLERTTLESIDQIVPYTESRWPTWIDVSGGHSIDTMKRLAEILHLHPLTLEDILNTDQRPKVEDFGESIFVVIKKPRFRAQNQRVELEQVSIILTARAVISVHEVAPGPKAAVQTRLVYEQDRIRRLGTDYLAYVIMDAIVDDYFLAMETFEDRIQMIEADLAEVPTSATLQGIHRMKQEVILMRKSVWPLREVINLISHTSSPLFDEGIKVYLKDLRDHIIQMIDVTDVYRDMLSSTLDLYLSTMSHRMNEVMKTLTMIASIFIPLTLITGIYGMNFADMPELNWVWGYPLTLGVMIVVAIGMLAWFKRRRWF